MISTTYTLGVSRSCDASGCPDSKMLRQTLLRGIGVKSHVPDDPN